MAVNKPMGDNARKGAVKKRTQLASRTMSGEFMDQKEGAGER
jgi:hypothetical protein